MDSVNLLRHMAPIAAVLLVPVTVLAEREVLKVVRQKAVGDQSECTSCHSASPSPLLDPGLP